MRRQKFNRSGALALAAAFWGIEFGESKAESFETIGDVAVVNISGPLTQHREWFFDSYESIVERVTAAAESSCKAIVLRLDSPGGDAAGCFETARALAAIAAANDKPLYAYAEGMAASAAYALACSATAGFFTAPTARVGSIGVITMAVDQTALDAQIGLKYVAIASGKRKTDGHPHVAISEDSLAAIQTQVDDLANLFFTYVAESRPLSADAVRGLEAGTFIGARAVEAGLADGVATFDELLATVASGKTATTRSRAAEETDHMTFEEMVAKLRETAKGDGEEADKAKKMLTALDAEESDEKKDDEDKAEESDEKKDDEDKAEESDEKKDDEDKAEDKQDCSKASTASTNVDLAATVNRMSAQLRKLTDVREATERKDLLATRPDLAPELVAIMMKRDEKTKAFTTPIATVREICKSVPKKAPAKRDTAAAAKAQPTLGAGQGGTTAIGGITRASARADELDMAFGLKKPEPSIKREGNKVTFGAMTPNEAREHLEAKKKAVG